MWSISIAFLSIVIPFIPMLVYAVQVFKFLELVDENKELKEIEFYGQLKLSTLMPKKMECELRKNHQISNEVIKNITTQYRKVFYTVGLYGLFWIGYIIYIVFKFNSLINFQEVDIAITPEQLGAHWATWFINIIIIFKLLIAPICETFGVKKVSQIVDRLIIFIMDSSNKIMNYLGKYLEKVFVLVSSLVTLYLYISVCYWLFIHIEIPIKFYTILPLLMFYQYILIIGFSKLLSPILKKILKGRKIYEEIIREIIQNSTYLCLVVIYSYAVYISSETTAFPVAAGILFMIDTYIKQLETTEDKRKKLIEKEENKL